MPGRPPHGAAFTVLELLAGIAIIGVLASLLLPALGQAKVRARDAVCLNNLRQAGVSFRDYLEELGGFPPAAVIERDPLTLDERRKSLAPTVGGVNPPAGPYAEQYCQATNRPLNRFQGNPQIFRCPMDRGHGADLDWPLPTGIAAKPSAWETAGCSYRYNVALEAPQDPDRSPPLPPLTLRPVSEIIATQPEAWVRQPDKFILLHEPPAGPLVKRATRAHGVAHWTQWHRNRGRTDILDPTIAPPLFFSPILFVDGHAALHDFSKSVMTDPYYPYEETKDWQWYQPRD